MYWHRLLSFTNCPPHTATSVINEAFFGQGTGAILLNSLFCTGTEATLFDCPHGPVNCDHSEDAGVICTGIKSYTGCTDGRH